MIDFSNELNNAIHDYIKENEKLSELNDNVLTVEDLKKLPEYELKGFAENIVNRHFEQKDIEENIEQLSDTIHRIGNRQVKLELDKIDSIRDKQIDVQIESRNNIFDKFKDTALKAYNFSKDKISNLAEKHPVLTKAAICVLVMGICFALNTHTVHADTEGPATGTEIPSAGFVFTNDNNIGENVDTGPEIEQGTESKQDSNNDTQGETFEESGTLYDSKGEQQIHEDPKQPEHNPDPAPTPTPTPEPQPSVTPETPEPTPTTGVTPEKYEYSVTLECVQKDRDEIDENLLSIIDKYVPHYECIKDIDEAKKVLSSLKNLYTDSESPYILTATANGFKITKDTKPEDLVGKQYIDYYYNKERGDKSQASRISVEEYSFYSYYSAQEKLSIIDEYSQAMKDKDKACITYGITGTLAGAALSAAIFAAIIKKREKDKQDSKKEISPDDID